MKKRYLIIAGLVASFAAGYFLNTVFAQKPDNNTETTNTEKQNNMKLGAFSGSWFGIFKTRSIA